MEKQYLFLESKLLYQHRRAPAPSVSPSRTVDAQKRKLDKKADTINKLIRKGSPHKPLTIFLYREGFFNKESFDKAKWLYQRRKEGPFHLKRQQNVVAFYLHKWAKKVKEGYPSTSANREWSRLIKTFKPKLSKILDKAVRGRAFCDEAETTVYKKIMQKLRRDKRNTKTVELGSHIKKILDKATFNAYTFFSKGMLTFYSAPIIKVGKNYKLDVKKLENWQGFKEIYAAVLKYIKKHGEI